MTTTIHTIRVHDKAADRCHAIYGADQADVIGRAKAACAAPDYYEVEQWRINGTDPTAEHGTYISGYTTQSL